MGKGKGKKPTVELWTHRDRRGTVVVVDDQVVTSVNYDDHGRTGIEAVNKTATVIATLAGLDVVIREQIWTGDE